MSIRKKSIPYYKFYFQITSAPTAEHNTMNVLIKDVSDQES